MRTVTCFFCLALVAMPFAAQAKPPGDLKIDDPQAMLQKFDDLYRGDSAHGRMRMKVVTKNWSRELEMEFWSKGTEKSLIRIHSPAKEKGTATLKSDKNIWNYLPRVKRVIKVPSSMMGGAWMGSHFTNDDLVKESRTSEDFDLKVGTPKSDKEWLIVCMPKPDAAVVWGKVEVTLRRTDQLPTEVRYYDEDQKLVRTMTFSDFKKLGGRTMPLTMRMVPADKKNESTEVSYQSISFNEGVRDALFTLRNLQK